MAKIFSDFSLHTFTFLVGMFDMFGIKTSKCEHSNLYGVNAQTNTEKHTRTQTKFAKTNQRNQSLKTQILLLSLSSTYDTSNNAGMADSVPQYVHRYV